MLASSVRAPLLPGAALSALTALTTPALSCTLRSLPSDFPLSNASATANMAASASVSLTFVATVRRHACAELLPSQAKGQI